MLNASEGEHIMMVTVFTATFNRAGLLGRVYESLCGQTCRDFEWLVVDDGSADDTRAVVEGFAAQGRIPIRYIWKPNGGKHTAINVGAREARGELFFTADADDWLPPHSIATVIEQFEAIKDDARFAGVCGLDAYDDGKVVGGGLPQAVIDGTSLDIRYKHHVTGDLKEVFRTSVMREFPFPEIEGERFCPEDLVWNRIATRYMLRCFNTPIYIAEYQPNGLTANITKIRMKSPVASMMTYSELACMPIPVAQKIKAAINYWRFALCARKRVVKIALWAYAFAPLGWAMHLNDKKVIR